VPASIEVVEAAGRRSRTGLAGLQVRLDPGLLAVGAEQRRVPERVDRPGVYFMSSFRP
jgi:hypothetical protein